MSKIIRWQEKLGGCVELRRLDTVAAARCSRKYRIIYVYVHAALAQRQWLSPIADPVEKTAPDIDADRVGVCM